MRKQKRERFLTQSNGQAGADMFEFIRKFELIRNSERGGIAVVRL